jgi:hypothetical protein
MYLVWGAVGARRRKDISTSVADELAERTAEIEREAERREPTALLLPYCCLLPYCRLLYCCLPLRTAVLLYCYLPLLPYCCLLYCCRTVVLLYLCCRTHPPPLRCHLPCPQALTAALSQALSHPRVTTAAAAGRGTARRARAEGYAPDTIDALPPAEQRSSRLQRLAAVAGTNLIQTATDRSPLDFRLRMKTRNARVATTCRCA